MIIKNPHYPTSPINLQYIHIKSINQILETKKHNLVISKKNLLIYKEKWRIFKSTQIKKTTHLKSKINYNSKPKLILITIKTPPDFYLVFRKNNGIKTNSISNCLFISIKKDNKKIAKTISKFNKLLR